MRAVTHQAAILLLVFFLYISKSSVLPLYYGIIAATLGKNYCLVRAQMMAAPCVVSDYFLTH